MDQRKPLFMSESDARELERAKNLGKPVFGVFFVRNGLKGRALDCI